MKNRPTGRLLCACAATALLVLAAAPAAFGRFGSTTLRKGAHGHDVRVLQSWLDKLGYRTSIDGAFGRGTQRSVRRFEKKEKLKVDGIVDRAEAKLLRQRMDARQNGKAGDGGGSVNGGSDTTVSNPNATTPGAKARMSSDGHTALAIRALAPGVVAFGLETVVSLPPLTEPPPSPALPFWRASIRWRRKIGRASCRERV